jgi:lipid II:glycine glycyltransferase (peptidoglycan interpeptide bridge formation enzyme)
VAFTDAPPGTALRNGLLFCRVPSWITGSRLVSLPFSDHCEPLVVSSEALPPLLDLLRARISGEGRYIEIRPLTELAASHGFSPAAEYCLHSIDLRSELSTTFGRFHRSHVQRSIRKAERLGVVIETGRSVDLLNAFYALHTMTRRRHAVPVQPHSWFRNLVDSLGDRVVVLVARYQGRAVAAMIVASHDRTVVYKYGCSDAAYHHVGATSLLFWRAIQDAKAAAAEELDLGRTDLDDHGLLAFKDHLGGSRRALTYYRYPKSASSPREHTWTPIARQAYALVPRRIQAGISRAFYRHFA